MKAIAVFRNHKEELVRLWTEAVFNTYPFETTGFLRTKKDPFGNPVADMTREAAAAMYDAVAGENVDIKLHAMRWIASLNYVQCRSLPPVRDLGFLAL